MCKKNKTENVFPAVVTDDLISYLLAFCGMRPRASETDSQLSAFDQLTGPSPFCSYEDRSGLSELSAGITGIHMKH